MSLCIIGEAKLSIRGYGNHSHGVNEPEGPDCRGPESVLELPVRELVLVERPSSISVCLNRH